MKKKIYLYKDMKMQEFLLNYSKRIVHHIHTYPYFMIMIVHHTSYDMEYNILQRNDNPNAMLNNA
jgi:hypothetical protein